MPEYTPTTEEIREYVGVGGEPRPWIEMNDEEDAKEAARAAAFDRWLADHDKEVAARTLEQYADSHWSPTAYYLRSCAYAIRAGGDTFPEQHVRGLYSDELQTMVDELREAHRIAKDWAKRNADAVEVAQYVRNTLDVLELELQEWTWDRSPVADQNGDK